MITEVCLIIFNNNSNVSSIVGACMYFQKNQLAETTVTLFQCPLQSFVTMAFLFVYFMKGKSKLDTVQDCLIMLGIKPCLHILKISIFFTESCHHQTYQNYEQPSQSLQNLYFQSYFLASKINPIFLIFFFCK